MSEQFDLFGTPEAPANHLEAAFWEYHAANPHIYELCRLWMRNNPEHDGFFTTRRLLAGPVSEKLEAA